MYLLSLPPPDDIHCLHVHNNILCQSMIYDIKNPLTHRRHLQCSLRIINIKLLVVLVF